MSHGKIKGGISRTIVGIGIGLKALEIGWMALLGRSCRTLIRKNELVGHLQ
jgi:hypothetical protein